MNTVLSKFRKKENVPADNGDNGEKVIKQRPKSLDNYKKKSNLFTPTIASSSKTTAALLSKRPPPRAAAAAGDWVSERRNGQSRYKVEQTNKSNQLYKPSLTKSTPNLAAATAATTPTSTDNSRLRPPTERKIATLRRGKGLTVNAGIPTRQKHDDLSRASSVSNLAPPGGQGLTDAEVQHQQQAQKKKTHGVLSKARKSLSKDRLDDDVAAGFQPPGGGGTGAGGALKDSKRSSVRSIEIVEEDPLLRERLAAMTAENAQLLMQLNEQRAQIGGYQKEIGRLKMYQEQSAHQMEQLNDENASLRNKLRDVVHSPLSDNEKQQLLLDSHRHHSSAPASIAPNLHGLNMEDNQATSTTTTDWDKQSTSNVSDVSVACLQDKINQMQETHYSTNEELQATLHELTDMQKQLADLQADNERLADEKNLMFDSLCRQTERLNDTREEVENLKAALYREDHASSTAGSLGYETALEREAKLVEMLKCAQDEREMLLVKQEQLTAEGQDLRSALTRKEEETRVLGERLLNLESALDAKQAEHRQLEHELTTSRDVADSCRIECDRLNDHLENARTKIVELEQERTLSDKSEAEELLDNARKEKDSLEAEVANLKEHVARGRNETEKLREQVSVLQEECKVLRNNAKCTRSELEYKVELLTGQNKTLQDEMQRLEEAANELQVQAQCHLEDKRQLSSVLSETQRNMSEVEIRKMELEAALGELQKSRDAEMEEWEKFQNDLLTSVRVANDFKNEAQQELQKFVMENKAHRERIRQLEAAVSQQQQQQQPQPPQQLQQQPQQQLPEKKGKRVPVAASQPMTACACPTSTLTLNTDTTTTNSNHTSNTVHSKSSQTSSGSSRRSSHNQQPALPALPPPKRLSKRHREIITQINQEYAHIMESGKSPEELTIDELAIVKLKQSYDRHFGITHRKPTASKPLDDLAVSRPLLDSVLQNPSLKTTYQDADVLNVESEQFYEITRSQSMGDLNRMTQDADFQAKFLERFRQQQAKTKQKGPLKLKHLKQLKKKDIGLPIYNSVLNDDDLLRIIKDESVQSVQPEEVVSCKRYQDPVRTNGIEDMKHDLKSLKRWTNLSEDKVFVYSCPEGAVKIHRCESYKPEEYREEDKVSPRVLEDIKFDFNQKNKEDLKKDEELIKTSQTVIREVPTQRVSDEKKASKYDDLRDTKQEGLVEITQARELVREASTEKAPDIKKTSKYEDLQDTKQEDLVEIIQARQVVREVPRERVPDKKKTSKYEDLHDTKQDLTEISQAREVVSEVPTEKVPDIKRTSKHEDHQDTKQDSTEITQAREVVRKVPTEKVPDMKKTSKNEDLQDTKQKGSTAITQTREAIREVSTERVPDIKKTSKNEDLQDTKQDSIEIIQTRETVRTVSTENVSGIKKTSNYALPNTKKTSKSKFPDMKKYEDLHLTKEKDSIPTIQTIIRKVPTEMVPDMKKTSIYEDVPEEDLTNIIEHRLTKEVVIPTELVPQIRMTSNYEDEDNLEDLIDECQMFIRHESDFSSVNLSYPQIPLKRGDTFTVDCSDLSKDIEDIPKTKAMKIPESIYSFEEVLDECMILIHYEMKDSTNNQINSVRITRLAGFEDEDEDLNTDTVDREDISQVYEDHSTEYPEDEEKEDEEEKDDEDEKVKDIAGTSYVQTDDDNIDIMRVYNSQKEDLEEVDVQPEELQSHHVRYKSVVNTLKLLFNEPLKRTRMDSSSSESLQTEEDQVDADYSSQGLKMPDVQENVYDQMENDQKNQEVSEDKDSEDQERSFTVTFNFNISGDVQTNGDKITSEETSQGQKISDRDIQYSYEDEDKTRGSFEGLQTNESGKSSDDSPHGLKIAEVKLKNCKEEIDEDSDELDEQFEGIQKDMNHNNKLDSLKAISSDLETQQWTSNFLTNEVIGNNNKYCPANFNRNSLCLNDVPSGDIDSLNDTLSNTQPDRPICREAHSVVDAMDDTDTPTAPPTVPDTIPEPDQEPEEDVHIAQGAVPRVRAVTPTHGESTTNVDDGEVVAVDSDYVEFVRDQSEDTPNPPEDDLEAAMKQNYDVLTSRVHVQPSQPPPSRSSEKVAALKKRFEGVSLKDSLDSGPTFHDIRAKPRKQVEEVPKFETDSDEVKIKEEILDPMHIEGGMDEGRSSFQLAKKVFEQGK